MEEGTASLPELSRRRTVLWRAPVPPSFANFIGRKLLRFILTVQGLGAFVLITLGVVAASTWAFIELKGDWIAKPEVAISFFTWGVYLALVFLRTAIGWRGRKAAIMTVAVLGFAAITWGTHARLGSILFRQ